MRNSLFLWLAAS